MATFEQRFDSEGRVTAVRVKVRRAGQAHLSRTFKLAGSSQKALAAALREARDWVQRWEAQQASLADAEIELPSPPAPPSAPARSTLARHFGTPSTAAQQVVQQAAQQAADDSAWQTALLALLQCADLSLAELQNLRWQHLAWDARELTLPGQSGLPLRRIALTPTAVEALLALKCRKHGPVFKQGVDWLASHRPNPSRKLKPQLS